MNESQSQMSIQINVSSLELAAINRFLKGENGSDVQLSCDEAHVRLVLRAVLQVSEGSMGAHPTDLGTLLFARCKKHYQVPQLNTAEVTGAECGACIAEKVLSFDVLQAACARRSARCWPAAHAEWSEADWATAMAGECGEACNFIKKRRLGELVPVEAVGKELADAVCYAALLAQRLGISLGEAVRVKFNEVSERVHSEIKI